MQQRLALALAAGEVARLAVPLHLRDMAFDLAPAPDLPRIFVNQLSGNSLRQSVMYLPPKTPSRNICAGVSSGAKSGAKLRPAGATRS